MCTSVTRTPSRPVLGMLLVLLTVFLFALGDAVTKQLVSRYPVQVVMAGRFLASFFVLLVFVGPYLGQRLWLTERKFLVIVRSSVMIVGSLTMGLALQRMPIGETIAIVYVAPLVVMLTAIPLFGEKVSAGGWGLAAVGFMGVLVIARPGSGLDPLGLTYCVANVACFSVYQLLTRVLSQRESSIALITNLSLVGALLFSTAALPSLSALSLDMADIGLIVALGGIGTIGHFLYAVAFRFTPASLVAPIQYFHLVWAALLGWALFGHLPDSWTLIGMLMIVLSGVASVWLTYHHRRGGK
jgi:drug/metabolite transporter (DMT)-like permease